MAKKGYTIDDYKDRMTCPIAGERIDKNGKPIKAKKTVKKTKR